MAKENSNSTDQTGNGNGAAKGSSPDPKMRSFLRQAAAVISAERGLNDISTAKLQLIAERLRLPPATFEEAMRRLKKPAHDQQQLHHYEKAFVQLIEKEMTQLKSGILTIKMENKLIELAESKYQITEIRAQQLIQKTAARINVRTISHADAEHFAEQLIVDMLGDKTKLEPDKYQSLYKVGGKWGQQSDAVDRIVGKILGQNRSRRRRRLFARLGIVGVLGAITFAGYYTYKNVNWSKLLQPTTASLEPAVAVESKFRMPNWASSNLIEEVVAGCESEPLYEIAAKDLFNTLTKSRGQKYSSLVQDHLVSNAPDKSQRQYWALLRRLYFAEPNEANAAQLIFPLVKSITIGRSKATSEESQLRKSRIGRAYRANKLLAEIIFPAKPLSSEKFLRRKAAAINAVLPVAPNQIASLDRVGFEKQTATLIATQQWNHELGLAYAAPNRAAGLLESIEQFSRPYLKPQVLNLYRSRAIDSLLDANSVDWKLMKKPIERGIAVADEKQLSQWISRARKNQNRDFNRFLLDRLVSKTGIKPATNSRFDIEAELTEFQNRSYPAHVREMLVRLKRANEIVSRIERSVSNLSTDTTRMAAEFESDVPDLIAKAAYASNLLLALEKSARELDPAATSQFDLLLEAGMPTSTVSQPPVVSGSQQIRGSLSAYETRTKNEAIEKLSKSAPRQTATRATALKSIVELSSRIEDLDYSESAALARYFLNDKSVEEWFTIEKSLPQLSHWPTLKLAVADQMSDSNVVLDQAITLTTLLCDCENDFNFQSGWKNELINRLLQTALEGLSSSKSSSGESQWGQLRSLLASSYQTRAEIVSDRNVSSGSVTAREVKIFQPLANAILNSEFKSRRIENAINLMVDESTDSVRGCAIVSTILGDALSKQLDFNTESFVYPSNNSGRQLLVAEINLMRIASKLVEQLIRDFE